MPTNGSVSCIELENADANHVLVTFSNYGVSSVWETTDGGTSWTAVEGNLPDMPVRGALFNPNDSSQVLLATELGVWSTDNLNGSSTVWAASNLGLANVRVDMLQYRSSDNLVIAATHGRGVYSSDIFPTGHEEFDADKIRSYTGKAIQFTDASYKATSWSWTFGDGATSTLQNPSHSYASPGWYNVSLSINSGASSKTRNNYILILPNRGTPYLAANGGNFDVNPDDFGADTIYGSQWQRGSSAITGKQGTYSGSYAWVTDLTGSSYYNKSETYLYTPNFKMLTSGTYTIKFRSRFRTESDYDGFRVEYSLNKGDSWQVLGSTGGSWYNTANTSALTAFPINEPYFSGNYSSAFNLYSYDMSSLAGNANVAFRFAFKADYTVQYPGVAIDNFEITGAINLLAADILSFGAKRNNTDVLVDWRSEREVDLDKYVLQRADKLLSFEDITSIKAGDNRYNYRDINAPSEALYYRLKMIDRDGAVNYSNVLFVDAIQNLELSPLTLYPNPAKDVLYISVQGSTLNKPATIDIFSTNGKQFAHFNWSTYPAKHLLDISTYPKGAYLLVLTQGSKRQVRPWVKY